MFERFPYTNFHELNLDWIIQKIKEEQQNAVISVNGETGEVVLYRDPDIQFPDVDSNTWRMVRTAGGNLVGIMFQNGLAYIMDGQQASRIYTVDDPPAYPVTSVNGQTGAIVLYPGAGIRFPDVTEQYMNIRRQIDSEDSPAIVGLEVDKTKAKRMNGTNRYDIYDSGNPPPYPVTSVNGQTGDVVVTSGVSSVNGQTGAVVLAIPFDTPLTDSVWMANDNSSDHTAGIGRETVDGTVQLYTVTDSTHAEAYIHFVSSDDQYNYTKKLLTIDDIPSGSGVISINSKTGVVTLYATDINVDNVHNTTIETALKTITHDIAIIIDGNTSTQNILADQYVCVINSSITGITDGIYRAMTDITANTPVTSVNLYSLNNGGLNDINDRLGNASFYADPTHTVKQNTPATITVPYGWKGIIWIASTVANNSAFWLVTSNNQTGEVTIVQLNQGSYISKTTSNNVITVSSTSTANGRFEIISFAGDTMPTITN